jgi:hypothetical protein
MRFDTLKGLLMRRTRLLPFALATTLAACSESGGPDTGGIKPPGELTIIQLPAGSPAIWNPVDSFYAKKGDDRELEIFFTNAAGTGPGEEYLRLRVDAGSLYKRPDGTLFQVGDSILIKVSVVDPQQIYFDFQPSGLTFNPSRPAELKIEYAETSGDLDDDGDVDGDDNAIEQVIDLWRQEFAGQDFVKLGAVKIEELDEIEADILGFTRYAIAY